MKKLIGLLSMSLFLGARSVSALTINITYNSSVTVLTNAAQVEAAFAAAAQTFQILYTNAVTINITMYWGPTGPFTNGIGLGMSSFPLVFSSYSEITNALRAHRASAADTNSVASLPAVDPTGGTWLVPLAEARVLGFNGLQGNHDGDVGFASNVNYTLDPNNRSVPGKFDFIGVAEHEISEVLGRCTFDLQSNFVPYDLFRFANVGVRSFDPNAINAYFSVDNGATALRSFYTNMSMGDVQDWKTVNGAPDAYDAFSSSGHILPISTADVTTLDVLGYNGPGLAASHLSGSKSNGNFQLTFTNLPGVGFTVVASTNIALPLTNWTVLGTASESPAGQFQFMDTLATNKVRFYGVRSF